MIATSPQTSLKWISSLALVSDPAAQDCTCITHTPCVACCEYKHIGISVGIFLEAQYKARALLM